MDRAVPDQEKAQQIAQSDILNALSVAILCVDCNDKVRYANASAEALFGFPSGKLQQNTIRALLGENNFLARLIARVREGSGALVAREARLSGLPMPFFGDIQLAPMPGQAGHTVIMFEERHLSGVLTRQSTVKGAARSVIGVAAMLAHEIKNPLSGIRGAAQLLEKRVDEASKPLAALIREEVDRIGGLVNQLETFTDTRPTEFKPVNIHTVLNHVRDVGQSGFAADILIRENYDPSLPPVLGDRDQLIQMILNLLKNAAEAISEQGEGGYIELRTAYRHGLRLPDKQGGVRTLPVEITVSDSGPGVPDDILEHVFEPFVTNREGGSGLGLAMVAKIAAEHGGLVEVKNEDRGATFSLLLPAAEDGDPDV